MSELPIPAKMYFSDFAFDLVEYKVQRSGSTVATFHGLLNKDENGRHISFLYGSDIRVGDLLTNNEFCSYSIHDIKTDTYNGVPELIKAYYW